MCWYPCQNMRDIIADICAGNMKWTFSALREMIAEISKGQPRLSRGSAASAYYRTVRT